MCAVWGGVHDVSVGALCACVDRAKTVGTANSVLVVVLSAGIYICVPVCMH